MMRVAFPLLMTAALLGFGPAAANTVPFGLKKTVCAPQSSCIESLPAQSLVSAPMSAKPEPQIPVNCVRLVMGVMGRTEAAQCEAFAASGKGTPRQRATALVNFGHWQHAAMREDIVNSEKSFATWDRAIAEDPSFAEPHVAKAASAASKNRHEEAIANFDRGLALDPRHWRAMLGKALVMKSRGQIADALALVRVVVDAAPGMSLAHQYYAHILVAANDLEGATAAYRKAGEVYLGQTRRVPGLFQEPSPWGDLARLEVRLGRLDRALEAADRLVNGEGDDTPGPYDMLLRAEINEKAGRAAEAANDYEKAVYMFTPGHRRLDDYRARIAMLRASAGNSAAAGTAFRDLIRSGKLQSILRVQVFLNNRGFDDVAIDGKPSAALERALERCLADKNCTESMGRSI